MSDETSRAGPKGIGGYTAPAGGWGALKAVARVLTDQETVVEGGSALMRTNQPEGFDCPGCAWPDPKHTSSFEFCENGAKAVAWEATSKRTGPELFAAHTVTELLGWSDHQLEDHGRLTHPMAYDPPSDRYVPVSWDEAFERIAASLNALASPDEAEFYASGRASNEAAFLFGLFARTFGTNNLPDCSNMCHEPTSVALPDAVGVGKGSVSLEDFDEADAIFSFGHNPGTNHPRMMSTLRAASKRGAPIVVFNPMKERALERFASPQDPVEMATGGSTPIASRYYQCAVGGDHWVVRGIAKALFEKDALDHAFIAEHTAGLEVFRADVEAHDWPQIEAGSGLSRADLDEAAAIYARSKAVILCYGMGITQHRSASSTVQQLMNLLLLGGHIGRPGAGICPVRGHSNVQGARTVGLAEKPSVQLLDSLEQVFGIPMPRRHGHTVVEAIEALRDGRSKALICLGGNFAVAAPDPVATHAAVKSAELTVNIATKLNRTHLLVGKAAYLLPCLGRTETDVQATGEQAVTVEDSMSMVHASRGRKPPASGELQSEPWIVAEMAKQTLGDRPVEWRWLVEDYDRIRDLIEQVFPDQFAGYNDRIRTPGGFRLPLPHADRVWKTASGKANFIAWKADGEDARRGDPTVLLLTSVRSHDQYNTTIYGGNDRYRGVFSRRDVVFLGAEDMARLGIAHGDVVDLVHAFEPERAIRGFTAVARELPAGSVAAYYPETNGLMPLADRDQRSGTPAYKSVPVRVVKAGP